jgi:ELWxxDGT repeat protein
MLISDSFTGAELWRSDGTVAGTWLVTELGPDRNGSATDLRAWNGALYFIGHTEATGTELWRSDGTAAGTHMVKDLCPGTCSGAHGEGQLAVAGQWLVFASDGRLARSDGTEAGTIVISTFPGGSVLDLTTVGGHAYFFGSTPTQGAELYRTDGTSAGTVLVRDINPGIPNSSPRDLTAVDLPSAGPALLFTAETPTQGRELWIARGGTAQLLLDAAPGPSSSTFYEIAPAAGRAYLMIFTAALGAEIWTTDGTPGGTFPLTEAVSPGPGSTAYSLVGVLGGHFYFNGSTPSAGAELWRTDGSVAGTTQVLDIVPGAGSSPWESVRRFGNLLVGLSGSVSDQELWGTDGTAAGTSRIVDLNPSGSSSARPIGEVQGRLLFALTAPFAQQGLWSTDGTAPGSQLLVPFVVPTTGHSNPISVDPVPGTRRVVFFATTPATGQEIWSSDGSPAGTFLLRDAVPGSGSGAGGWTLGFGNRVYYPGSNGLWATDGTVAGTALAIPLSGTVSTPVAALGAFFFVRNGALWRSDGTAAGTTQISTGVAVGSHPLVVGEGFVWFLGSTAATGSEIWRSDGTANGTALYAETIAGPDSAFPLSMVPLPGRVVFTAVGQTSGRELWQSNGATAAMLVDIVPGVTESNILELTRSGDFAYFSAGREDVELWRTDGTPAGTQRLDLYPGSTGSYPDHLTDLNGMLVFAALHPTYGRELWRSNGHMSGTSVIADIGPGVRSSLPREEPLQGFPNTRSWFTVLPGGAQVVFPASGPAGGMELWRSDGTATGTALHAELWTGHRGSLPEVIQPSSFPRRYEPARYGAGRLWFSANDGVHGIELWSMPAFSSSVAVGTGCAGNGVVPQLRSTTPPAVGNAAHALALDRALPNSTALLFLSLQTTATPLQGGCWQYLQNPLFFAAANTAQGTASWTWPIPADPWLVGQCAFAQAAVVDPNGPHLGQFVLTPVVEIPISVR